MKHMKSRQVSAVAGNKHPNEEYKTLEEIEDFFKQQCSMLDIEYYCYAHEMGKQGQTPHLQFFIRFNKRYSIGKIHKLFQCYVEPKRYGATDWDNVNYIKKEGIKFVEWGQTPSKIDVSKNTKEERLHRVLQLAREGDLQTIEDIYPSIFMNKFNFLYKYSQQHFAPEKRKKCGFWLVGSSGTGKSRFAHAFGNNVYNKPPDKWFDNYDKHSVIVIDDLDRSNAKEMGNNLKIWADPYPNIVQNKGSSLYLHNKFVIVTSNYRINQLYTERELSEPIHRRYKELIVLGHRVHMEGFIEIQVMPSHDMQNRNIGNWNMAAPRWYSKEALIKEFWDEEYDDIEDLVQYDTEHSRKEHWHDDPHPDFHPGMTQISG